MSISKSPYSSDVIKYGDVEKEKEIEKRLKELGLWNNKVHQEREVEKMLEEQIGNSDKLSQVIRRARRRRERSHEEIKDESPEINKNGAKKDKRTEGMKTMDEIRNIVKPSIIRDKKGVPLAYHIDVTMGCFTHDVAHHVLNDGYTMILFGATSSSNPLASMSFLSSKSLPSLFSPTISPRSTFPQQIDVRNNIDPRHLGSTLRGKNDDNNGKQDEETKTGVRRLTKEISVELPKTVDVSQLFVDYRKGIFKIRVPFFLESTSDVSREQPAHSDQHHFGDQNNSKQHFLWSRFEPIKCQTSKLTFPSSSPSSPSLKQTNKPNLRSSTSSPLSSPSHISPALSSNRAFHCSLLSPSIKTCSSNNVHSTSIESKHVHSPLIPSVHNSVQFRQTTSADCKIQPKQMENLTIVSPTNNQFSLREKSTKASDGLLIVVPRTDSQNITANKSTINESETNAIKPNLSIDNKTSWEFNNSFGKGRADALDAVHSSVDQARYNGDRSQISLTSDNNENCTRSCEDSCKTNSGSCRVFHESKSKHNLRLGRKENDLKSCRKKVNDDTDDNDFTHQRDVDYLEIDEICDRSIDESNNKLNEDIEKSSFDDLVLVNSAWSNDNDLDSLLIQCLRSSKKVKRSKTEEISAQDLNRWTSAQKTKLKKKIRSKSLPGFVEKMSNNLSMYKNNVTKDTLEKQMSKDGLVLQNSNLKIVSSDVSLNSYSILTGNGESLLDLLEESNV